MSVDDEVEVGGSLTLEEIAEACSSSSDTADSDEEMEVVAKPVSLKEAKESFGRFREYVQSNFSDMKMLKMCDAFDDLLYTEASKKQKQASILDFLKSP